MATTTKTYAGEYARAYYFVGQVPDFSRAGHVVSYTETKSGVQNPGWKQKVRNHQNATSPYTCDLTELTLTKGWSYITDRYIDGRVRIEDCRGWFIQAIQQPQLGVVGNVESRAFENFVKKANAELRPLMGLVTGGELRDTLKMFINPLGALKQGIHNYLREVVLRSRRATRNRPGRKSRKQILSEVISGTYLEYANGWKPLANDILAASRVLAETLNPSGLGYRKINASAANPKVTIQPAAFLSSITSGFSWVQRDIERRESSCRLVGEVVARCSGDVASVQEAAGFTLRSFVPSAWELIPMSYVADYFFNIGNALEAWCFTNGSVAWYCRTTRLKSVRIHQGQVRVPPTPGGLGQLISFAGDPGRVVITRTSLLRGIPSGYTPSLAFVLPERNLLERLANVSSLLVQARSSSTQISSMYR